PFHLARPAIERDERIEIEVVAAPGRTDRLRIGPAVAHADDYLVELRIVDDRVPGRAAAADLPRRIRAPGLQRGVERLALLGAGLGIVRDGPETPRLRA